MPDTTAATAATARKGAVTRRKVVEAYLAEGASVTKAATVAGVSAKHASEIVNGEDGRRLLAELAAPAMASIDPQKVLRRLDEALDAVKTTLVPVGRGVFEAREVADHGVRLKAASFLADLHHRQIDLERRHPAPAPPPRRVEPALDYAEADDLSDADLVATVRRRQARQREMLEEALAGLLLSDRPRLSERAAATPAGARVALGPGRDEAALIEAEIERLTIDDVVGRTAEQLAALVRERVAARQAAEPAPPSPRTPPRPTAPPPAADPRPALDPDWILERGRYARDR